MGANLLEAQVCRITGLQSGRISREVIQACESRPEPFHTSPILVHVGARQPITISQTLSLNKATSWRKASNNNITTRLRSHNRAKSNGTALMKAQTRSYGC